MPDKPRSARKGGRSLAHDEMADAIIADCEGDARKAVIAMLRINRALMAELRLMAGRPTHAPYASRQ